MNQGNQKKASAAIHTLDQGVRIPCKSQPPVFQTSIGKTGGCDFQFLILNWTKRVAGEF